MIKLAIEFFHFFYNSEYLCYIDIPYRNSAKISSGSGEEVDFVIFAILETAAIFDIQPDPIIKF